MNFRLKTSFLAILLAACGYNVYGMMNDAGTLHGAARRGDFAEAQRLIELGTVIDIRNDDESIPLHVAAQKGRLAIIDLLLEHGADIHAKNFLVLRLCARR
jgi:Ankyrin repeat.